MAAHYCRRLAGGAYISLMLTREENFPICHHLDEQREMFSLGVR